MNHIFDKTIKFVKIRHTHKEILEQICYTGVPQYLLYKVWLVDKPTVLPILLLTCPENWIKRFSVPSQGIKTIEIQVRILKNTCIVKYTLVFQNLLAEVDAIIWIFCF